MQVCTKHINVLLCTPDHSTFRGNTHEVIKYFSVCSEQCDLGSKLALWKRHLSVAFRLSHCFIIAFLCRSVGLSCMLCNEGDFNYAATWNTKCRLKQSL